MGEQPSLNLEALARLDLRPDEILAVTLGIPGLTVDQCEQVSEYLACWLHDHGQPVAGVMVLPQGSGLAAVRAPEPVAVDISRKEADDIDRSVRGIGECIRRTPPGQF